MILKQSQADAIYSAICNLNNVGVKQLTINIDGTGTRVIANHTRGISVVVGYLEKQRHEKYATQSEFCAAYNLN